MFLSSITRGILRQEAAADTGEQDAGQVEGDEAQGAGVMSSQDDGQAAGDEAAPWFYAEGVPGSGDRPDFLADKYKTVVDQAKAYRDAETRVSQAGEFFGAPEDDYELTVPEGFAGEFNADDPLLTGFLEDAKALGLSQKGVDKLLARYIENNAAGNESVEQRAARVAGELGENGALFIRDTWDRLQQTGMTPEMLQGLDDALGNPDAIRAIAYLMQGEAQLPANVGEGAGMLTRDKVRAMRGERVTEGPNKGKRRYDVDPDWRAEVDAAYKRLLPGQDVERVDISPT